VRENSLVASRTALCPVLVRRDDQLAILEDALLEARRGESRFVVLSGEAGIGKTRLATEMVREARQLGCSVLAGSCSGAELSLPYLPFVEAIGNYIDSQHVEELAERLGPARSELAQLFPQFGAAPPEERSTNPTQAKMRLFEAIVSLLAIPAQDGGLLLVIEDVHWADEATRELLDHLARRLTDLPIVVLVTYRSDELDRRHPFVPTLQGWRRSGLADVVELKPLSREGVGEMIAAIVGSDEVDRELSRLMEERTEGNPFVLEEMLRDAVESSGPTLGSGSALATGLRIPDTVKHSILLRLERLEPEQVAVLETAAVLGRKFDYAILLAVSEEAEQAVLSALEAAIAQQLIEEQPDRPGSYGWRHALTQETIYGETVTPRRRIIHARAAEVLSQAESTPAVDLAHHLLGAGKFDQAVPVCLRSAEAAEGAAAYGEAISLLRHALPHIADPLEQARTRCRIGRNHWLNGESAGAREVLREGTVELDQLGETLDAARFRLILGRCAWETEDPAEARAQFEQARDVLVTAGPSGELALAHMRLAGMDAFELNYVGCLESSKKAVEIAEQAGADFERVWALGFVGLGYLDSGEHERGFEVMDAAFDEAREKGYWQIANNIGWNEIWTRSHTLQGGMEERMERLGTLPKRPFHINEDYIVGSYVKKARGQLDGARHEAERGAELHERLGYQKMAWRARVHLAEVLTELGRFAEAEENLPPASTRTELQDIVYDAQAQIRLQLALGKVDEAAGFAREIASEAPRLAAYRETLEIAAQAMVAAGEPDAIETLIEAAETHPSAAGAAFADEMQGRLLLARGDPEGALPHLQTIVEAAEEAGYPLVELRARVLLAQALAGSDERGRADDELHAVVARADELGAALIAAEAREVGEGLGIELPAPAEQPLPAGDGVDPLLQGERLVTSVFADVRGYSELAARLEPKLLSERMAALYRLAKVAVERRQGIVDKFAGDAVMATFNATGARIDHCVDALEAALTLRDKAALVELPVGIGIAVGPAVLGKGASDGNIAVRGVATNLASRLQALAGASEILLSDDAHRRVEGWLSDRDLVASREDLTLKGFDGSQVGYRLAAPADESAG
jgi:class 3 adenylate cyclase